MTKKDKIEELKKEKCEDCGKMICECGSTMREEKWMQGAVKKPGQLHKDLGISPDKEIPMSLLKKKKAELQKRAEGDKKLSASESKLLKKIIFAINAKKLHEGIEELNRETEGLSRSEKEEFIDTIMSILDSKKDYWMKFLRMKGSPVRIENFFHSLPASKFTKPELEYLDTRTLNGFLKLFDEIELAHQNRIKDEEFQYHLNEKSPPGYEKQVEDTKKALIAKGYSEEKAANIAFGKAWNEYKGRK